MQLPIVCSSIAGNIDIVTNNKTGLTFNKANEQQLLETLKYALANNEQMDVMANQLLNDIKANYRRENIWQKMLEAYKTLVH